MWSVIAAIGGAIVGGIVKGVTATQQRRKMSKAYANAAKQVREATDKYSGENLYNVMRQAGDELAYIYGRNAERAVANQFGPNETNNQFGMATNLANIATENASAAAQGGRQAGMANKESEYNARYNAAVTKAQQELQQAGVEANAANQRAQSVASGLSNTIGLVNQVGIPNMISNNVKNKQLQKFANDVGGIKSYNE